MKPQDNSYKPAFPLSGDYAPTGLTKREYAAIHLMSGLMADSSLDRTTLSQMSVIAISGADVLLANLDKVHG